MRQEVKVLKKKRIPVDMLGLYMIVDHTADNLIEKRLPYPLSQPRIGMGAVLDG